MPTLSFLTGGGGVPSLSKKMNWISNKRLSQTCLLVMSKQKNSTDKTGLPGAALSLRAQLADCTLQGRYLLISEHMAG